MFSPRNAFTLIELLVVIAIIAILAVVVVLTLNPAEMLRQARDSNRLSDLATLQNAINLYNADQGGANGYSLGSSGVTYVSVPDPTATTTAGSDCSGLGFPAGGTFHCPASSTYKNASSTGWIPINFQNISSGAPISNLPVDPTNTTSSNLYYTYQTDGLTFKLRAVPESQKYLVQAGAGQTSFTTGSNLALGGGSGWVLVPGSSQFGTNNFYVMKYDAVCSDGEGNVLNDTTGSANTTSYHIYANDGMGGIACTGSRQIASLPGGYPIADITETEAKTYCSAIGAHLLTNDEYMTIVTNAVNQGSNWYGGTVGTNYVYSGHNNGSPYWALPADANDANGYSGETNQSYGSYTNNQRRTYTLSNGAVIWDMSGNLYQEVQRSTLNQGDNTAAFTAFPVRSDGAATWGWGEYGGAGPTNDANYITSWSTNVAQANVAPPNGSWNSTNGMGLVYTYGNGTNPGPYSTFIRGNFFASAWGAGPFTLFLEGLTGPGYMTTGWAFRCAR
jgi:prepilin-type N-terminal cleavage/methylation domain-containing protein